MTVVQHIRQLGKESVVYGLSGLFGKVIGLALIPVYTRVFAPSDYGIIALLTTLIDLANMFVLLGLDSAAARWYYNSEELGNRRSTIASWFWCQFSIRVAFAGSLMLWAPAVSHALLGSTIHATLVRLAAAGYVVAAPAAIAAQWFRYSRRPVLAVSYGLGQTLVTVSLTILFVVVLRHGLRGLYTAQLLAALLAAMVAMVFLRGWISPQFVSRKHLVPMVRYALPLIPAAVGYWVMGFSDRFILRMFHDTAEIGLYSIAATLAGGMSLIVGAFGLAWTPFAYSIMTDSNAPRTYARVLDVYAFFMCALCAGLTLYAPWLLRILSTEPYYPAASCVAFLAFAVALEGGRCIVSVGSGIAKKSVPIASSVGVGAAVSVGLNFALIPAFGRNGAAVAKSFAYASAVAYQFLASQRYYPIPYRWVPSLASFALAFMVVVLDWSCLPATGIWPWFARLALLSMFVPLGMAIGLIRVAYIKQLLGYAAPSDCAPIPQSNSAPLTRETSL